MTDGGGRRKGEREGGQWDPSSSSLDIIQDHCHSLYKPNSFFVVGRGRGEGESRFRGHFVFGFTYWAGISLCVHFQTQIIAPYKFD